MKLKIMTNAKDLKWYRYTVIDRNDGNWMTEGILLRILYPEYPIPSRWMEENYPMLNHEKYASIYPRLVIKTKSGEITSAPMNLKHFTIQQEVSNE